MKKGWFGERYRHSLARKGIKTGRKNSFKSAVSTMKKKKKIKKVRGKYIFISKKKPKDYKYKISYFDPEDPKAERWKTWKFRTLAEAKEQQDDLRVAWKSSAREFRIKKIKEKSNPEIDITKRFERHRIRSPNIFIKSSLRTHDIGRTGYSKRIAGRLKSTGKWKTQSMLISHEETPSMKKQLRKSVKYQKTLARRK